MTLKLSCLQEKREDRCGGTLLLDHIKPQLRAHGLDWVDFQVMRRTHARLSREAGIDPKVQADQRGHAWCCNGRLHKDDD